MEVLLLAIYSAIVWFVFIKMKWLPWNTGTQVTVVIIPIVALTGHALAGISEGAKRAGCDAFVTKPCLPEDLVKEIRNVLASTSRKPRRTGKYAKTNS